MPANGRSKSWRWRKVVAIGCLVGAFALASCGGDDNTASDDTTPTVEGTAHTAVAEQPPEELAAQASREMMSLGGPAKWAGADTSPSPAEGKTVALMPCSLQIEVCRFITGAFEEAAETIGFETTIIDGQSDPTKEQAALDVALNQGIDCLVTFAAPVRDIAPQATRMRDEGIPIIEAFAGTDGDVLLGLNQKNAGAALAAHVIASGGGDIIVTDLPQLPELTLRTNGFTEYIKRFGDGKAKVVDTGEFTIAELGPGQEAKTRALLTKNPTATWFYTSTDVATYAPLDTAKQLGRKMKGVSFDGDPPALADLRDGPDKGRGMDATISWALDWVAWSGVDECNRAMQDEETGVNTDHPIKLTTAENVPDGDLYIPAVDFKAKFKELWGTN